MDVQLLAACGNALYGPHGQAIFARNLGFSRRTLNRWLSGNATIPPKQDARLDYRVPILIQQHINELTALLQHLKSPTR